MEQGKKGNAFTRQEIEQHLQSALTAAAPDIWSELELRIQAEQDKGHESISVETREKSRIIALHRRFQRLGAAAAACICLAAFGGGYYHYQYVQVASQVEIDVNPSLKLFLNRKERVVKAEALNEDGAALLEGSQLTGRKVGEAVEQVVDSLVEQGYLRQGKDECALLVSVAGKNSRKAEQLKDTVSQDVETALAEKEVSAVVYDQVIQVTRELEELADTYQVSLGKAEFVGQLIQENQDLSQEQQEYSRMISQTMEELNREIGERSYSLNANVTIIKPEAPSQSQCRDGEETEMETSASQEESAQIQPEEPEEVSKPEEELASLPEEAGDSGLREESVTSSQPEESASQPESREEEALSSAPETETETESSQPEETAGTEAAAGTEGVTEPETDGASSIVEAQGGRDDSVVSVDVSEDSSDLSQETDAQPSEPAAGVDAAQPSESETGMDAAQPSEPAAGTDAAQPSEPEADVDAAQPSEPETGADAVDSSGAAPETDAAKPLEPAPAAPGADAMEPSGAVPEAPDMPSQPEQEGGGEISPTVPRDVERIPGEAKEEENDVKAEEDGAGAQPDFDSPQEDGAEKDSGANRQVIPAGQGGIDDFGPGDVADAMDEGMTITENGTVIIAGEEEKKEYKEPVYASQMLSGFERSLLQKGPGMFFGRIAEDGQDTLLRYGPGFAYLYEGEHYRGSDYTRVRIKPSKGQVYRVDSGK